MAPPPPPVPHPIPYQGSKRRLAPAILAWFPPGGVRRLYEPFAGSGAVTLAAAARGLSQRYVLADAFAPLAGLWRAIAEDPAALADRYEALWKGATSDPRGHYDRVRHALNARGGAPELLYVLARCVKSAVRFNAAGAFNQSADRRRLGTRPATMRAHLASASALLRGRVRVVAGDYGAVVASATARDLVYLDPPYQGTSFGRDRRYAQPLDRDRFVAVVAHLVGRGVPVLVSYDGRTGERSYGEPLPPSLGLHRVELPAGRSSQATLHGRAHHTVESLYVSPDLVGRSPPALTRRGRTP